MDMVLLCVSTVLCFIPVYRCTDSGSFKRCHMLVPVSVMLVSCQYVLRMRLSDSSLTEGVVASVAFSLVSTFCPSVTDIVLAPVSSPP